MLLFAGTFFQHLAEGGDCFTAGAERCTALDYCTPCCTPQKTVKLHVILQPTIVLIVIWQKWVVLHVTGQQQTVILQEQNAAL